MNTPQSIQWARRTIRKCIAANPAIFTDQKVAEIYAFNLDGKMGWYSTCACWCGVMLARALHVAKDTGLCDQGHYAAARQLPNVINAEHAYLMLGSDRSGCVLTESEGRLRQLRLSTILRAEMRRRDRARSLEQLKQPGEPGAGRTAEGSADTEPAVPRLRSRPIQSPAGRCVEPQETGVTP